jgi:hypothetical protein
MAIALALAFRWRKLQETGAYGTIEELATVRRSIRPTLAASFD